LNHFTVPVVAIAAAPGTLHLTASLVHPRCGNRLPLVTKLRFPACRHKSPGVCRNLGPAAGGVSTWHGRTIGSSVAGLFRAYAGEELTASSGFTVMAGPPASGSHGSGPAMPVPGIRGSPQSALAGRSR
jgi:hypothetical protein